MPSAKPRVVSLTLPLRLLIPPLFIPSLSKKAIAFTFLKSRSMALIGIAVLLALPLFNYLIFQLLGPFSIPLSLWLLGSGGLVILANSLSRGLVFVKPLCRSCKLKPIILVHEQLHLQGIYADDMVWEIMRRRSLLQGWRWEDDPEICNFCPIPLRCREIDKDR